MNDNTNDIIYTARDIEHYLSGKLTPLQMHKMEKAALDDPFLAEAIEGYAGSKEKEWKHELAGLKNKFENNEQGAKVIPMAPRKNNWWKIAAAVLLIGSTSTVAYLLLNKKDPVQIAGTTTPVAKEQPHKDSITTQPATVETSAVTPGVKPATTEKNNVDFAAGENTVAKKETKLPDSAFVYSSGRLKPIPGAKQNVEVIRNDTEELVSSSTKPVIVTTPPVNFNNTNTERKAEENKSYSNNTNNGLINQGAEYDKFAKSKTVTEREGYNALKKEVQLNRNFIAQVVGPDNSPLPFANISIKSENFGTYADAKGNFRLVSSDSVITVEVKAAGYQPKFYTLQSYAQQNKIVLSQDDEALKYKAISGNSTAAKSRTSRRATLVKDSLVNVEPADGWDNYNTYVDNNLDIPEDIITKNIHGRVELSFDVKSNGTITNIKVDKSLCDNCDEVAKRLIEQGPQWKVKKGKKGKGKVTVEF